MEQNTPNIKTIRMTIPAFGSTEFYRDAEFITVLGAADPFQVKIDNGPKFDLQSGITVKFPNRFQLVELLNNTATPLTVELVVGKGNVTDSRVVLSEALEFKTPDVFTTSDVITIPSSNISGPVLILPQNSRRREFILNNISPTNTEIYLNGADKGLGVLGVIVNQKQTIILETTSAIWGHVKSGSPALLTVSELGYSI